MLEKRWQEGVLCLTAVPFGFFCQVQDFRGFLLLLLLFNSGLKDITSNTKLLLKVYNLVIVLEI